MTPNDANKNLFDMIRFHSSNEYKRNWFIVIAKFEIPKSIDRIR